MTRRIPSEAAFIEEFGVSRPTVREALAILEEEGRIVTRRGKDRFVVATADQPNE